MRPYLLTYLIIQGLCSIIPLINETNALDCDTPTLVHGKVRTKNRGKVARYQCLWGYELMGQRYGTCTNGRWDSESPVCFRPGCELLFKLENGIVLYMKRTAVAMFFCNPGYQMEGPATVYCDGVKWNTTAPFCREIPGTMPNTSCDFEQPGICGWKHDPLHDFDWRRQNKNTPSGHIGTGPSYDHTLGYGKTGYYMYIESSSRLVNDSARLLSPIFPANLTQNGCFVFYYHMYGRDIGSLRIIVRPESTVLQTVIYDNDQRMKYQLFEKSGNQGNVWFRGFFELDVLSDDFQIVIEGIRGKGYVSDIAIDDVAILQGEECVRQKEIHMASTSVPYTTRDSCLNRCNQQSVDSQTISGEGVDCQCQEDCVTSSMCCVDYRDLCVFGITDIPNFESTTANGYDDDTTQNPPPLPPSLKMTATNKPDTDDQYPLSTTEKNSFTTHSFIPTRTPYVINESDHAEKAITPEQKQKVTEANTKVPTVIINKTQNIVYQTRPVLWRFATFSPPFKNATRFLNNTEVGKKDGAKNSGYIDNTKYTVKNEPTGPSAKFIPGKKLDTMFNTTDGVPKFSKTYYHYGITTESGKLLKGIQSDVMVDKTIVLPKKHEKLISLVDDAHIAPVPRKEPSISTNLITVSIIIVCSIVFAIGYAMKKGAATKLVDQYTKLRKRAVFKNSSDNMRFLVQEEELEHEYEDL